MLVWVWLGCARPATVSAVGNMNATAHADYDALALPETATLLLLAGTLGVAIYMLVLLSYFLVPNLKAQHPAANLIIWHVGCGFMTSFGLVVAYGVQVSERRVAASEFHWFGLTGWTCGVLDDRPGRSGIL